MKIYFCDNLAESQVEDSLNVIFVATFSFMIFYSFFYDLLVEIVFLWSLWFFGCPKCGNDFYDFLLQSLVILMIFMILMILNFLFIEILLTPSVFVNSFPRLGVHTKYARLGGNEAAAAPVAALLSQWCGFVVKLLASAPPW